MTDNTELLEQLDRRMMRWEHRADPMSKAAAKAIRELVDGQNISIRAHLAAIDELKEQVKEYDKLCVQAIPSHSIKLIAEFHRIKAMGG